MTGVSGRAAGGRAAGAERRAGNPGGATPRPGEPVWSGERRRPWARLRTLALVVVLLAALLAGAYVAVKKTSLSAVRHITITGLSGADASEIHAALVNAAAGMSTLAVRRAPFHDAVAAYPEVKSVRLSAGFPHSLAVRVTEQQPVAVVIVGGRRTVVSGDGTLLVDASASRSLPAISATVAPGVRSLHGTALQDAELLAAAPSGLLSRIESASHDSAHGLIATLTDGPRLFFGGAGRLQAKWDAVLAVLADAGSAGAGYVDVSDPERPAAGPVGVDQEP